MSSVISFNIQMFEMFLLGYAFSACSSLLVFPVSSRKVTMTDIRKMFDLVDMSATRSQPFGTPASCDPSLPEETAAHEHVAALTRIFAKYQIDISDAKKDIGWSRFSPGDFNEILEHFRLLVIPLNGIYAVESIRASLHFGSHHDKFDQENALEDPQTVDSKERWDTIFAKLQMPMSRLHELARDSVDHCRMSMHIPVSTGTRNLPLNADPKAEDAESEKTARNLPGGSDFLKSFETEIRQQCDALRLLLLQLKDEDGPLGSVENVNYVKPSHKKHSPTASQGRLLFTLYIEHLYNEVCDALLDFVVFCDQRFSHSSKRLQLPGKKRFLKLIHRLTDHHHVEGDLDDITSEIPNLAPQRTRMPEADKPTTRWVIVRHLAAYPERVGQIIGSRQSFFGFRVACAIMTIAIVAFLGATQQWFFNRRGIWAAVFIPFSMAPSSGEAKSMLLYRVFGSMLSIVIAIVNWYIVDGIPAGIIVFFMIFATIQQIFLVKFPQFGSFWRPCIITYSIIVGYSLQAKYDHTPQPPATTSDSFPIYEIGPYRGLCTIIGVAVAYFWTIFPQPTTANSIMRQRLGQALFTLGEYHNCMHWAVTSWATGHPGDMKDKSSEAHRLMKIRRKLFARETAILAVIRDQYKFAGFDINLSGRAPEHRYVKIADEVDRIMTYLNIVILISARFHLHLHDKSRMVHGTGPWESGVSDLLVACRSTSRQIASTIHILASSVTNDQPLPPFLESPESFAVARKLREMRPDLMDVKHAHEEGYKAFAVIEVSVAMLTKSLDRILLLVKEMVGEVGIDVGTAKQK